MVVSNIFYFHPYLGKWSNLTNIFISCFRGELLVSGRVSKYLVREVEVETRPSEIYWFILKYQNLLDCEILQLIPNEELIDKLILSGYCSNIINISLDGDFHTKFLSPPPHLGKFDYLDYPP